ncbi:hypothetical protein BZA77DRAFT_143209 [Pyronema omphalodes]|nr:hypothetical protein BZA77DRAFT_143209 [Pyronema omphalodes]
MFSLARIITRAPSVRVSVTPVTLQLRTAATKASAAGKPAAATKSTAAKSKTAAAAAAPAPAAKRPTTKPKTKAVEVKAKKAAPTKKTAVDVKKAKKLEEELAKKAAKKQLLLEKAKEAKAKAKAASLKQKEILKARELKTKALEKKKLYLEKALLDAPIKRTRKLTAFNVYLGEKMAASFPADGSAGEAKTVFATHTSAFKNLSESEKQKYVELAEKRHLEEAQAYQAFIEKYTPVQIKEANAARRWLIKNNIKKGSSVKPLVDDRLPSARPANIYAVFLQEQYKLNPGMSFEEARTNVHGKWKTMSEAEKKAYREQAEANKLEYNAKLQSLGLKA